LGLEYTKINATMDSIKRYEELLRNKNPKYNYLLYALEVYAQKKVKTKNHGYNSPSDY
jgi:hypothetical protein